MNVTRRGIMNRGSRSWSPKFPSFHICKFEHTAGQILLCLERPSNSNDILNLTLKRDCWIYRDNTWQDQPDRRSARETWAARIPWSQFCWIVSLIEVHTCLLLCLVPSVLYFVGISFSDSLPPVHPTQVSGIWRVIASISMSGFCSISRVG